MCKSLMIRMQYKHHVLSSMCSLKEEAVDKTMKDGVPETTM